MVLPELIVRCCDGNEGAGRLWNGVLRGGGDGVSLWRSGIRGGSDDERAVTSKRRVNADYIEVSVQL